MSDSSARLKLVPPQPSGTGGDDGGPSRPDGIVHTLYTAQTHSYDGIYSKLPGMELLENKRAYAVLMHWFYETRLLGIKGQYGRPEPPHGDDIVDLLYRVNTHLFDALYTELRGMDQHRNVVAYLTLMRDFWDARVRGFPPSAA